MATNIQIEDIPVERRSPVQAAQLDRRIPARNLQFKDFGVLETGKQSKASTATAVVINLALIALAVLLGAAAKQRFDDNKRMTMLVSPVILKPVTPPPPAKLIPVPELPKPVVKMDPPKIKLPDVKLPDVPKPAEVKMTQPAPVIAPAAPKKIVAPPAPVQVNLARAASVVNDSPRPTAVALGSANNPIAPSNRPATANVNLGQRGLPGMPSSNNGGGPAAAAVSLGSGSPNSQTMAGNGSRPVQGVKLGVAGGTGPLNATGRVAGQVNLGQALQPAVTQPQARQVSITQSAPKVLYKPTPAYTPEATALHVSGAVAIKIRVSATGSVTVLGITSPLGHGLDQSAERAIEGTRFSPAVDANGRPVDWEGVVRVNFQLAS
jgi:TonB family protein